MSLHNLMQPRHIGDGVYTSFDGHHIWLAVNHHENHVVALDPAVRRSLADYIRKIDNAVLRATYEQALQNMQEAYRDFLESHGLSNFRGDARELLVEVSEGGSAASHPEIESVRQELALWIASYDDLENRISLIPED